MKVLFVTPVLEHPPAGGPQLRIENSIKALSRVCDLHIVSRVSRTSMGGEKAEKFFRSFCRNFAYVPAFANLSDNKFVCKFQRIFRRYFSLSEDRFILDYIENHGIDVVWCGYGNISFDLIKKVKKARPALKVVCDTDSVWSRFILRELPYEKNATRRARIEREGKKKEAEEQQWVNLCEVTTAVSKIDAEYYRSLANDSTRIMLFSNVIDIDSYLKKPEPPVDYKHPCIYLAGTFWTSSPMEQAARWILHEVLPEVLKVFPDLHFYIVGKGSKEVLQDVRKPQVTITGMLPSVLPYLCHADVALVPLKFESGTRFKILEAAACGVPIVSTTLGAEGIPVEDGKNILIADEADAFVEAIVQLINDRSFAHGIAKNCYDLVKKDYSIEALTVEAEAILERLSK